MIGRIASGIALASMAGLMLGGCATGESVETSTPSPTVGPSNAVNEEALLAETREAWDRYQELISEFGAQPEDATLEPLLSVAAPDVAAFLLDNFEQAAQRRIHTEGERITRQFDLVHLGDAPDSVEAVVCVDVSGERVVADEGGDFTPEREPLQVSSVRLVLHEASGNYVVAAESAHDPEDSAAC